VVEGLLQPGEREARQHADQDRQDDVGEVEDQLFDDVRPRVGMRSKLRRAP
jgi:hypothetical protein